MNIYCQYCQSIVLEVKKSSDFVLQHYIKLKILIYTYMYLCSLHPYRVFTVLFVGNNRCEGCSELLILFMRQYKFGKQYFVFLIMCSQ